jgi:hypothetical protein
MGMLLGFRDDCFEVDAWRKGTYLRRRTTVKQQHETVFLPCVWSRGPSVHKGVLGGTNLGGGNESVSGGYWGRLKPHLGRQ